jgi:hypothetical protein
MLQDSVEAIGVLSLIVLPIVIAFAIVVSITAALRSVGCGDDPESTHR